MRSAAADVFATSIFSSSRGCYLQPYRTRRRSPRYLGFSVQNTPRRHFPSFLCNSRGRERRCRFTAATGQPTATFVQVKATARRQQGEDGALMRQHINAFLDSVDADWLNCCRPRGRRQQTAVFGQDTRADSRALSSHLAARSTLQTMHIQKLL